MVSQSASRKVKADFLQGAYSAFPISDENDPICLETPERSIDTRLQTQSIAMHHQNLRPGPRSA